MWVGRLMAEIPTNQIAANIHGKKLQTPTNPKLKLEALTEYF
jgi:hypothetical protein